MTQTHGSSICHWQGWSMLVIWAGLSSMRSAPFINSVLPVEALHLHPAQRPPPPPPSAPESQPRGVAHGLAVAAWLRAKETTIYNNHICIYTLCMMCMMTYIIQNMQFIDLDVICSVYVYAKWWWEIMPQPSTTHLPCANPTAKDIPPGDLSPKAGTSRHLLLRLLWTVVLDGSRQFLWLFQVEGQHQPGRPGFQLRLLLKAKIPKVQG